MVERVDARELGTWWQLRVFSESLRERAKVKRRRKGRVVDEG